MIKSVKKLSSLIASAGYLLLTPLIYADTQPVGINPPGQALKPGDVPVQNIPQFIITLLFIIGIIIAVAFLIYGGIKWILSGGDSKAVEGARNHIVAAIVGLIIVIGAFVILNIVFYLITGQGFDPTKGLCIPNLKSPSC